MTTNKKKSQLPRWKRGVFSALLIVCGLTVGLLFSEMALRWFAPVSYYQWMSWIPDGHVRGRGTPFQVFEQRDGYEVRINNLGFRGEDYSWEPDPGVLRIATFGGSSTFNYNAKGETNTWSSRLKYYLETELKMDVEVINLALPGYALETSKVNYLFLGRALNPHIAIVYHTWNDMKFFRDIDRGNPRVFSQTAPQNKPLWQRIARYSQVAIRVRNALQAKNRAYIEKTYSAFETETTWINQPISSKAWKWFDQNFIDFSRFTRGDQVIPVFVSQATLAKQQNLQNEEYRSRIAVAHQKMTHPILAETWMEATEHIRSIATQHSAIFVDGYDVIPSNRDYFVDHVHLTDKGMDQLANEIATALLQSGEVRSLASTILDSR